MRVYCSILICKVFFSCCCCYFFHLNQICQGIFIISMNFPSMNSCALHYPIEIAVWLLLYSAMLSICKCGKYERMCACNERFDLKANEINGKKTLHHIRPLSHLIPTRSMDYKMMIKLISTIIFALTWLYIHSAIHIPMFSIHLSHPFIRFIFTLTLTLQL